MKPPYVFHPNDAFPCWERQILTTARVAGSAIPRRLFRRDELTWIDGWVAEIMSQPDLWVQSWTEYLALRASGPRHARAGENQRGIQYSSRFLASFAVHHTVVALSLKPSNRPTLAAELRNHPYEAELLRGDPFAGSHVNGVLAESGGPLTVSAPPAEQLIPCAYCGSKYKQSEPRCTHCGAGR